MTHTPIHSPQAKIGITTPDFVWVSFGVLGGDWLLFVYLLTTQNVIYYTLIFFKFGLSLIYLSQCTEVEISFAPSTEQPMVGAHNHDSLFSRKCDYKFNGINRFYVAFMVWFLFAILWCKSVVIGQAEKFTIPSHKIHIFTHQHHKNVVTTLKIDTHIPK